MKHLGSASETTKMYSEVPQNEGQNNAALSPEYTELHQNHKTLQRRLQRLKLWNYFLSFWAVLCIALLAFWHKPSLHEDDTKKVASPVPESEFL